MKPTVEYLTERISYWIDRVFTVKLPVPPIHLSRSTKILGQVRCKRSLRGAVKFSEFRILFSGAFDFSQELLDDVILHELIHYHILYNQQVDTAPHGKLFRTLMQTINQRFNRHISISHRPLDAAPRRKFYYICVGELKDGRYIVASSPKKDMAAVERMVRKDANIMKHGWFRTAKPYFSQFPSSSEFKPFVVSYEQLKEQLGDLL